MSKGGRRKQRDPDPYVPADLESIFGILSIPDPLSGRIVKVKPHLDPITRQANHYAFYYLKQDGYFEFFDVRELQNWEELHKEHPPYRDREKLRKEWEARPKTMPSISFETFVATRPRDPAWEEYFRARYSHVKEKIVEAVNQGLLDLSG